jgi:hypothetical protein
MDQISVPQIRRVEKYSAYARSICSVLLTLWLTGIGIGLFMIFFRPPANLPKFGMGVLLIQVAFASGIVYLLRRVFANMAGGEIFSGRNVQHIRQLGFVFVGLGAARLIIGISISIPLTVAFVEPLKLHPGPLVQGALAHFGIAGIIFLASWIMQVGLGVSSEAAELRHDAELVV